MKILAILVLILAGDLTSELESLVRTERAFAQLSVSRGSREAFLANLADDSILFRPRAVPGKLWTEKNPGSAAQLSWEPAFADIARAADVGYTTGPWEIRTAPGDAPMRFGHYVTVWRKQPGGTWKIAIDIGITHAAPDHRPGSVQSPRIASTIENGRSQNEIQFARGALLDAERVFPRTAQSYPSMLAPDARVYRNNSLPFAGQGPVRAALAEIKGTFTWKVADAAVSSSLDLGYTYGTAEFRAADRAKPVEQANYLRIWKREDGGPWKAVVDLVD